MNVARQLHADDFQLINPAGHVLSKDEYLGLIASGQVDYLYWEPDSIAARVYDGSAVLRYRSQLEVVVFGASSLAGLIGTPIFTKSATVNGRSCGRRLRRSSRQQRLDA
jgi:hypothetical protein